MKQLHVGVFVSHYMIDKRRIAKLRENKGYLNS